MLTIADTFRWMLSFQTAVDCVSIIPSLIPHFNKCLFIKIYYVFISAPTVAPKAKSPIVIYRRRVVEILTGNADDKDGRVVSNVARLVK